MADEVQMESFEKQGSEYIVEVDVAGNLATTNESLLESDLMDGEEVVGEFDALIRSPPKAWITRFFSNLFDFVYHLLWAPVAWVLSVLLCCLGPLQCYWIDNYFCLACFPICKWKLCLNCLDKKIDVSSAPPRPPLYSAPTRPRPLTLLQGEPPEDLRDQLRPHHLVAVAPAR